MRVVYEPKGAAREYAPLAVNLYRGCSHGCGYCFGPRVLHMKRRKFAQPALRDGVLDKLEGDCVELRERGCEDEILLCFTCDPYAADLDTSPTRRALDIIGRHGLPALVLQQGGIRAARDFDLLERCGFRFGVTLVFADDALRQEWEPHASSVASRILAIRAAHERGIPTWVSLEPVIDPAEALRVIQDLHEYVDEWKVGKVNHMPELEPRVDWVAFRRDVTTLLDSLGATHYLKKSLRNLAA